MFFHSSKKLLLEEQIEEKISLYIYFVHACSVLFYLTGGERGIRTLDRGLPYTPLAGERFQPLSHLSGSIYSKVMSMIV